VRQLTTLYRHMCPVLPSGVQLGAQGLHLVGSTVVLWTQTLLTRLLRPPQTLHLQYDSVCSMVRSVLRRVQLGQRPGGSY
jgi:hypothetical protein